MIPLIEKEVVDNKGWVEHDEIADIFAVAQYIPGIIAINTASLIGFKIAPKSGSVIVTIGVLLPSFFTIICIVKFFLSLIS